MPECIRRAFRQPGLVWLSVLAGALALSWPLLDLAEGNCAIGLQSVAATVDCQLSKLIYLFVVWALLIALLLLMAIAGSPGRAVSTGADNDA